MNRFSDDERLSAYLDDALSPDERQAFEAQLATDDELRQAVAELRALRSELQALPRHKLAEGFPLRVLRRAERELLSSRGPARAASVEGSPNGSQSDAAKSDTAKSDAAKSDTAKSDTAKSDAAKSDGKILPFASPTPTNPPAPRDDRPHHGFNIRMLVWAAATVAIAATLWHYQNLQHEKELQLIAQRQSPAPAEEDRKTSGAADGIRDAKSSISAFPGSTSAAPLAKSAADAGSVEMFKSNAAFKNTAIKDTAIKDTAIKDSALKDAVGADRAHESTRQEAADATSLADIAKSGPAKSGLAKPGPAQSDVRQTGPADKAGEKARFRGNAAGDLANGQGPHAQGALGGRSRAGGGFGGGFGGGIGREQHADIAADEVRRPGHVVTGHVVAGHVTRDALASGELQAILVANQAPRDLVARLAPPAPSAGLGGDRAEGTAPDGKSKRESAADQAKPGKRYVPPKPGSIVAVQVEMTREQLDKLMSSVQGRGNQWQFVQTEMTDVESAQSFAQDKVARRSQPTRGNAERRDGAVESSDSKFAEDSVPSGAPADAAKIADEKDQLDKKGKQNDAPSAKDMAEEKSAEHGKSDRDEKQDGRESLQGGQAPRKSPGRGSQSPLDDVRPIPRPNAKAKLPEAPKTDPASAAAKEQPRAAEGNSKSEAEYKKSADSKPADSKRSDPERADKPSDSKAEPPGTAQPVKPESAPPPKAMAKDRPAPSAPKEEPAADKPLELKPGNKALESTEPAPAATRSARPPLPKSAEGLPSPPAPAESPKAFAPANIAVPGGGRSASGSERVRVTIVLTVVDQLPGEGAASSPIVPGPAAPAPKP